MQLLNLKIEDQKAGVYEIFMSCLGWKQWNLEAFIFSMVAKSRRFWTSMDL